MIAKGRQRMKQQYQVTSKDIWQGRVSGLSADYCYQKVKISDLNSEDITEKTFVNAVALHGFCSDEGVKRNSGRVSAAAGPDVIRQAAASLAWFSDLSIVDTGNICCVDANLEQAQQALAAVIHLIKMNNKIHIYTDGSCLTNPGNGGWAAIINENKETLKALNNQLKESQKRSDKIVKVLFNTEGLSKETRKIGSGGQDSISTDKPLDNSDLNQLYDQSRLLSNKIDDRHGIRQYLNNKGLILGFSMQGNKIPIRSNQMLLKLQVRVIDGDTFPIKTILASANGEKLPFINNTNMLIINKDILSFTTHLRHT